MATIANIGTLGVGGPDKVSPNIVPMYLYKVKLAIKQNNDYTGYEVYTFDNIEFVNTNNYKYKYHNYCDNTNNFNRFWFRIYDKVTIYSHQPNLHLENAERFAQRVINPDNTRINRLKKI
jgi:hypothetical protein